MPLTSGTRLGPYVVVDSLGAGGMGEVYRARDTRLDRSVAIKVLPAAVSQNEQARARFIREAKLISSLSHPHICTLHDVGRDNGVDFLVMELVEGETLASRLRKGPIPLDALLRIGLDIADALDKAHRSGIVHRDLKPGNVMLTKSGAKLLDFGLAKLIERPTDGDAATAPHTPSDRLTAEGVVVGTLDFMSPEQLERQAIDGRTDIFALGNILYLMATGHSAFEAESDAKIIAAILRSDPPPPTTYRPDIPRDLERVIGSCLRKDPDERIQSAHDVCLQLQWISESFGSEPLRATPRPRSLSWIAAASMLTLLIAIVIGIRINRTRAPAAAVRRLSINLPVLTTPLSTGNHEFAISPDGKSLVVALNLGSGRQLYVRSFDKPDLTPLPGTHDAQNPFFSPDSRWVGFASRGKLQKVPLTGGNPLAICDASVFRGGTWAADGTIVFAPVNLGEGLFQVSADGGTVRRATTLAPSRNEHSHRWPHFLPDGKHVLFAIDDWGGDYTRKKIGVVDLKNGETKILVEGGTDPRYVPGYLIFARERTLYAQKFDEKRLEVSGLPVPVLDAVVTYAGTGLVQADVSSDGTLIYLPYDAAMNARELVWVDRRGSVQPVSDQRRSYETPRLSPDNKQLLITVGESRAGDLWLLDVASDSWSRIATEAKTIYPLWSRDGKQFFYTNSASGFYNLYSMPADGGSAPRRLTDTQHCPFSRSISPDGRMILAEVQYPLTGYDVWSFRTDGGPEEPVLTGKGNEAEPDFSPDGRWFAYASNESGQFEVYIQRFPPSGRKWAVSQDGGQCPHWSHDGRELFFRNGGKLLVARVSTSPDLVIHPAQTLFEGNYARDYDVAADGQRFLMMRDSVRAKEAPTLDVVLDWPDEFERRFTPPDK